MFKYLGLALLSLVSFAQITTLPNSSTGGGGSATRGYGLTGTGDVFDVNTAVVPSLALIQAGSPTKCVSSTGNATYTCGLTPALTTYTANGTCLILTTNFTNVTTATLNVDAVGAKSILNRAGAALAAGDITSGKPITVCYDGTQFIIQGDGGGTTVAKNGLYLTIGSTDYIPETMFAATKPPQTGWSWVGSAGTEAFGADGSMVFTGTASATRIRTRTFTSETVAIIAFRCNLITGTANYSSCGVFLRESSTGKGPTIQQNMYGSVSAPYGVNLAYQNWSGDTYSGGLFSSPSLSGVQYVKFDWSTTNVILSTSPDGVNWTVTSTNSKASLFTTAPNNLAFFTSSQTPANVMIILSLTIT